MSRYAYKALNKSAIAVPGEAGAQSLADLENKLAAQGLELLHARPIDDESSGNKKLTRQELITFCFNLEQLIQAGISIHEGLTDFQESLQRGNLKNLIFELVQSIEGGKNLSQALREHPQNFSIVFLSMVEAGEESGALGETFSELTKMQKWEDELISSTRKLLTYPAISFALVSGAIIFLLVWLVPQLAGFIIDMGGKLPMQTKILMALSSAIINYWHLILITPAVLVGSVVLAAKKNERVQYALHRLVLRTPAIGPLYIKLVLARFSGTFALMFSAGVPLLRTLRTCIGVTSNKIMQNAFWQSLENIENGQSISQGFVATGFFPPLVIRMLHTGEKTGDLSKSLRNITYFYDREVKDTIDKLQALIGPTITVVLAAFIILILSSLLGPLFNLLSTIK